VHRYLDPRQGRWSQRDPLGGFDGINRYRYARNTPLSLIDRDGRLVIGFRGRDPDAAQDVEQALAQSGIDRIAINLKHPAIDRTESTPFRASRRRPASKAGET